MDSNRDVIELINKLQGYGVSTGCKIELNLPQIVVVGAQSSGKSSVLDGLIGASILPRGIGTVTKCPIIVQLITTSPDSDVEGIEFPEDYQNGQAERIRPKDYDKVRERIKAKMNGAFSDNPIIIRVFSPKVVDLTVVDLPGIKKNPLPDEPKDIEYRLKEMSRRFIRQNNAIILAVSPASNDISNSDGLQLAREVDPEGHRTIGVLTKLDLMDEGTNARDLLTGKVRGFEIKLGMIGVVNRCQSDVEQKMSVEYQLVKEKQFLELYYPDLALVNGTPYLRKRLHELLVKHINKCLPDILKNMKELLRKCEDLLTSIPDVGSSEDKKAFVGRAIYSFQRNMTNEIEGSMRNPECDYLYGGVKIKDVFEKQFPKNMDKAGKKSDALITDTKIRNAFRNSTPFDSIFSQPEAVFRKLAMSQLAKLQAPALKCAERVHSIIQHIASRCLKNDTELNRFPELRNAIKSVVTKMIAGKMENLKETIRDYVRVQANSTFTSDHDLLIKLQEWRRRLDSELR